MKSTGKDCLTHDGPVEANTTWTYESTVMSEVSYVMFLSQGMPHEGKFKRVGDLVLVCTSLIFTCSVQHAAVNASQYDEYAFPPNYPIYLAGQPPIDRVSGDC